jgi:putative ABC transport system permease protein
VKLLLLAQLRFLARAPWSAATALFGVTLAVASIVAVHQIGAAVERSLAAARPPHLAGLTHVLSGPELEAADYFRLRRAWREGAWPGITALVPMVEGHRDIGGRQVRVVGVDWLAYGGSLSTVEAAGERLPPARLLDARALVADRTLGVGSGATLAIDGTDYQVVALVDAGLGPAVFADIAVAQRLLRRSADAVDLIGIAAADPLAGWRSRIDVAMPGFSAGLPEAGLPKLPVLAAYPVRTVASELPAATFARAILFNVGALGILALLVAWFLVYQVAVIWVERQRPVFARLHALGATRVSVAGPFVAILALLGLVATLAGSIVGNGLAQLLIGVSAPDGAAALVVRLDGHALAKAAFSGIGVCMAGGLLAIRRAPSATAVRPMASRVRWFLIAITVVVAVVGIARDDAGLLGGFAAILAMSAAMILALRPLLEWLGPVPRATRADGALRMLLRLGAREAVWRPEVVGVALAALALAVSASMGVGLMVESLRGDFARMLALRLSGEAYANGPPGTLASAAEWLALERPDWRIDRYGETLVRIGRADADGSTLPARLGYGRFDAAESARYGFGGALPAGAVIVNERLARALGIEPGDAVLAGGARFDVAHVHAGLGDSEPRLFVDERGLAALGIVPAFDRFTVHAGGGDPAAGSGGALAEAIRALAERFPELAVVERDAVHERAFATFDRTFAITRALTLLALVVASVGMYNALTALRLAQAPTRRLLEVQGVLRRELLVVTLARAAGVGGIAVAVALPLGIAMAWVLCNVVNPRAFGWTIGLALDPEGWLPPVLLGLCAALLAGLLPAPRESGVLDEAA